VSADNDVVGGISIKELWRTTEHELWLVRIQILLQS